MSAKAWNACAVLFLLASLFLCLMPVNGLGMVSSHWNVTEVDSAHLHFIPLVNGEPVDDLIIIGYSTFIAEFQTANAPKSSWVTYDLSSGGSWRLESSVITPTSSGDYTSDIPVEKRDLIFEKSFNGGSENVYRLVVSIFNETTNITRQGGLPVQVAPNGYKLTYSITNWSFSNSSMKWIAMDICTNGYMNAVPVVSLFYPPLESNDPFYFVATNENKWALTMYFERWTLFDGEIGFSGQLIPSFSNSDDFYQRNQRNITLVYPISGHSNFEYDPTTFISLFGADQIPSDTPADQKHSRPYWIIGLVVGIIVVATILMVVLYLTVPAFQTCISPYTARQY